MKYIFFSFLMLLLCQSAFSQSKKEQIEILINQKDSLTKFIHIEREKDSLYKAKQDQLIFTLNSGIQQYENQLAQSMVIIEGMDKKLQMLEKRIKSFSDSIANLQSELKKFQELDLDHFAGVWCLSNRPRWVAPANISIGGNIFEGYSASHSTSGGGPFAETFRIERISKNKIILYLLAVEGTISFNESMGDEYFEVVEKCRNEKSAEIELVSEGMMKINTDFNCSFYIPGENVTLLRSGIYTKKKKEDIFCVD